MQKEPDASYALRDADYEEAAELLSYSILGPVRFDACNTFAAPKLVKQRLEEPLSLAIA